MKVLNVVEILYWHCNKCRTFVVNLSLKLNKEEASVGRPIQAGVARVLEAKADSRAPDIDTDSFNGLDLFAMATIPRESLCFYQHSMPIVPSLLDWHKDIYNSHVYLYSLPYFNIILHPVDFNIILLLLLSYIYYTFIINFNL